MELAAAGLGLGATIGMAYGMLAVGLVLAHRASGVLNFAHVEIGAFGAAALSFAIHDRGLPYWAAFPLAVAAGAGAGAAVEAGVVRRLRRAPKAMTVVATLGAGQVLLFTAVALAAGEPRSQFPAPPGIPSFQLGFLRVTQSHAAMLVLAPSIMASLAVFLTRTRLGLALRGAGDDAEAARSSGISPRRMATLAWAIAGAVAGCTTVLLYPMLGVVAPQAGTPALLVRALAAAALAGMRSLPWAFFAGVALGVVEQAFSLTVESIGFVEVVVLVVVVVALSARKAAAESSDAPGAWGAVRPWRPPAPGDEAVWGVRHLGRTVAGVALAAGIAAPVLLDSHSLAVLSHVLGAALVAMSVGVVTGLAGELSLGQFAIAGTGATVSYLLTVRTGNFVAGFAVAALAGAAVSVVLALPALRSKGLALAVATLSFAVAAESWLFQQPWMLGRGVDPGRPVIGPVRLETAKGYYIFSLAFVVAGLWVYHNLRAGGFGRVLVAVRDNERSAEAFAIRPGLRRVQAFATAGALAGVGGAVYGHGLGSISAEAFATKASIDAVAIAAIGGLATAAGPILGALYVIGLPAFVPLDAAALAATSLGWLLLVLYVPAGIPGLVRPARDRIVVWLRKQAAAVRDEPAGGTARPLDGRGLLATAIRSGERTEPAAALEVMGVTKRFGGVAAVDNLTLQMAPGEILGVIGPNGAGKTTLLDVVAGFVVPDNGRVVLDGSDITALRPPARVRLGLARSFQEPRLFPTMQVLDAVRLAGERSAPAGLLASACGARRVERAKNHVAHALIELLGLGPYADKLVGELSTGTRRVVELACIIGLRPRVVLLDEPSAGLARREVEPLAELLRAVQRELSATVMIVEHDLALVADLAERLVVMVEGGVVADGAPRTVLSDPTVASSLAWGQRLRPDFSSPQPQENRR